METDILNSKALKAFIKGSLTLIGLFFVLSCVVVVLLFPFDKKIEFSKKLEVTKNTETIKDSKTVRTSETTKDNRITDENEISKSNKYKVWYLISVLLSPLIVLLLILLIIYLVVSCLAKQCCLMGRCCLSKWYCLINCYLKKKKTPLDNKCKENLFKIYKVEKLSELYNSTAKAISSSSENEKVVNSLQDLLTEILGLLPKVTSFEVKQE